MRRFLLLAFSTVALAQVKMDDVGRANLPALTLGIGDLVAVSVYDAPELTRTVRVEPDGTIRLPFLGSFKVVGQTAAQVQAAIGKQMSDRKLGPANQVTVSVMRGR